MILANLAKRCAESAVSCGGDGVVRVMDTVKGLHPDPVIFCKSAPRRTVKLNMTWEGKGLVGYLG